ncbi:MAG TPA: hypothetical protein VFE05_02495 [Longimicrobiaceae bacterium]|jgi:hypothetical protein|nr:hypothetical protein [Longimicrobiaceae bacterium]
MEIQVQRRASAQALRAGPAPHDEDAFDAERAWSYVRAVYPLNAGLPHVLDAPRD